MNKEKAIEELESRVAILLEHVDTMRKYIESHEFDSAAMGARALELYCNGAKSFSNRLADTIFDDEKS